MTMFFSSRIARSVPLILTGFIFLSSSSNAAGNTDLAEGMRFVKSGQNQKALSFFDRCVDAEPTNGDYHFWRGKCLGALGKKSDAAAEFKLAAYLATDNKLKDKCRVELARYKISLPNKSVDNVGKPAARKPETASAGEKTPQAPTKEGKYFKLSSKKLQWNLELRPDFVQSMKDRTDRLGKMARADGWRLPTPSDNRRQLLDIAAAMRSGSPHYTAPLSADEKYLLLSSDIMIVLDHSGSMHTADCPAGNGMAEPRLAWCVDELMHLANELGYGLPHGYNLIVFDSQPDVHHIKGPAELKQVLAGLQGGGGTNLAAALDECFRLHTAHPQQPLLIAVVTDAEIDVHSCERSITDATRRFPLPNGVFITLLQIGHQAELHTQDQLSYLNNLHRNGAAAYDAVEGIPFTKVRSDGFGRDILMGLRSNVYGTSAVVVKSPERTETGKAAPIQAPADSSAPAGSGSSTSGSAEPPPIMWPAK